MNNIIILACIAVVAIIHASFQLSVSMLTLLSGHSLGKKTSHKRLLRLSNSFVFGATILTALLISSFSLYAIMARFYFTDKHIWIFAFTVSVAIGMSIWLFYYRRSSGTVLWMPRSMAEFLQKRTKRTSSTGEAFGLGATSVLAEFIFLIAPILLGALLITSLDRFYAVIGLVIYIFFSMLPLICVHMLINAGHSISQIQRWRERNKRFLQFSAGSFLIVISFFLYVIFVNDSPLSLLGVG